MCALCALPWGMGGWVAEIAPTKGPLVSHHVCDTTGARLFLDRLSIYQNRYSCKSFLPNR